MPKALNLLFAFTCLTASLPANAHAADKYPVLNNQECAELWETTYTQANLAQYNSSANSVNLPPVIGKALTKKPIPTVVHTCDLVSSNSSRVQTWRGQRRYDYSGNRIDLGICSTYNVIEVQGRKRNRYRQFTGARICRDLNNPSDVQIFVGSSQRINAPK